MPRHVALRQSSAHKFDKAERTFLEYLPVGYINIRENSPLSWTGFLRYFYLAQVSYSQERMT